MQALVRQAMEEGALGVGSSLIYAPAFYAKTDELIELCKVAAKYGGMYISHMRSEGNRAARGGRRVDQDLARSAHSRRDLSFESRRQTELGQARCAASRKSKRRARPGCRSRPTCTPTPPAATGLDAAMPPWVQEGGLQRMDQAAAGSGNPRSASKRRCRTPTDKWENFFLAAGSPDKILLVGFKTEKLKPLTGKTLAEVAKMRGTSPEETAMDLVIEDGSARGHGLFPDVGRERAQADREAVGEFRFAMKDRWRRKACF